MRARTVFILQVLNLILGYLYSAEPIRLKKRFLMKQFTIALGTTFCILIWAVVGGASPRRRCIWVSSFS